MDKRTFIIGEEKYVDFTVRSSKKDRLIITESSFILFDRLGNVVESGNCVINDNELRCLLTISQKGTYILDVTAVIPPETIRHKVQIEAEGEK